MLWLPLNRYREELHRDNLLRSLVRWGVQARSLSMPPRHEHLEVEIGRRGMTRLWSVFVPSWSILRKSYPVTTRRFLWWSLPSLSCSGWRQPCTRCCLLLTYVTGFDPSALVDARKFSEKRWRDRFLQCWKIDVILSSTLVLVELKSRTDHRSECFLITGE